MRSQQIVGPKATTASLGIVRLGGDLSGTADAPTVPSKADKTTSITGTGYLAGGGTLAADRTITAVVGTTAGTLAAGDDSRITGGVPSSRQIIAGTGLTGGGTLAADRTLAADFGTASGKVTEGNDSRVINAVQTTRTITAGAGLTGGGTLAADRTLAVAGVLATLTASAPITITGSRALPEQAVKNLLAGLATLGVIVDSTTA